jgi:hypothetical protein
MVGASPNSRTATGPAARYIIPHLERSAPCPIQNPLTMLCLASYEKGEAFLRQCKRQGCRVPADYRRETSRRKLARDAIDEVFICPTTTRETTSSRASAFSLGAKTSTVLFAR